MLPARRLGRGGSLAPWPSALAARWCTTRHASSLQRALAGTNYPTPNEPRGTSSLMEALTLPPKEEETVVPSEEHTVRTPPSALLKALDSRGLINQMVGTRGHFSKLTTDPEKVKCGAYAGIDPTAPSLHIGHLLPLMALYWMGWHGLDTVALVGDATAAIGDPTGRTTTRPVLSPEELKHNTRRLTAKLETLSTNARDLLRRHFGDEPSRQSKHAILTNSKWLHEMPLIVSLQLFGNAFRIGTMLSRDTARTKVASKEGMSLSEFMYPVLQAHDWFHLRKTRRVHIQIGGSDQYGNILSGSNAVWSAFQNRLHSYDEAERDIIHTGPAGITVPLLTTSSGAKFGKSAGNAIWLDATLTDPFDFYTYFVGVTDEDVGPMLKIFTFLPIEQIDKLMKEHTQDPSKRRAQHALAKEVTNLAHGASVAKRMSMLHSLMFQPISRAALHDFVAELPAVQSSRTKHGSPIESREGVIVTIKKSALEGLPPTKFLQALEFDTVKSATAASRLIAAGGAYIGTLPSEGTRGDDVVAFQRFQDAGIESKAEWEKCLVEGVLLVRAGKKGFRIVRVI